MPKGMKVFTATTPIQGLSDTPELEQLWRDSWAKHGWEPVVLSPCDDYLSARLAGLTTRHRTVNPIEYRSQCITRWVDLSKAGGGLMVDMDVINFGFTPEMMRGLIEPSNKIIAMDRDCPCAVYMPKDRIGHWLRFMEWRLGSELTRYYGGGIQSDQEMFGEYRRNHGWAVAERKVAYECHTDFAVEAKLVHFATNSIRYKYGRRKKHDCVAEFMKLRA
jgi:hypothetical protein